MDGGQMRMFLGRYRILWCIGRRGACAMRCLRMYRVKYSLVHWIGQVLCCR